MAPKQTQPLLLTNKLTEWQNVPPLDVPQYRGRHYIGIMRQKRAHRSIWRFVHRSGHVMFDGWYDEVRHFSHHYAAVRRGEKWHFINLHGKVACRHRFLEVGDVNEHKEVAVLHPTHLDIHTRQPRWFIYTLP